MSVSPRTPIKATHIDEMGNVKPCHVRLGGRISEWKAECFVRRPFMDETTRNLISGRLLGSAKAIFEAYRKDAERFRRINAEHATKIAHYKRDSAIVLADIRELAKKTRELLYDKTTKKDDALLLVDVYRWLRGMEACFGEKMFARCVRLLDGEKLPVPVCDQCPLSGDCQGFADLAWSMGKELLVVGNKRERLPDNVIAKILMVRPPPRKEEQCDAYQRA